MKPQELNWSHDREPDPRKLEFEPNLLPSDADAAQLLINVGVPRSDVSFVLGTRPDPEHDHDAWRLLDRSYRLLTTNMGRPLVGHRGWPAIRDAGVVGAFAYVWAFLTVLPIVRAHHAAMGLTDVESWDSLAALGREVRSGSSGERSGLGATWGLPLVFSGTSFRLGRLAFDRRPPCEPGDSNAALKPGEASWNIHVPSGGGPIPPAAVTASMDRALELSDRAAAFCCHSWLMDPQLVDLLPPDSNIVRFQARFDYFTDSRVADGDLIQHVFRRTVDGAGISAGFLDQLPQDTTLQRGIVSVLRSGRHWHIRTGWFRVSDPSRCLAAQELPLNGRERENGEV